MCMHLSSSHRESLVWLEYKLKSHLTGPNGKRERSSKVKRESDVIKMTLEKLQHLLWSTHTPNSVGLYLHNIHRAQQTYVKYSEGPCCTKNKFKHWNCTHCNKKDGEEKNQDKQGTTDSGLPPHPRHRQHPQGVAAMLTTEFFFLRSYWSLWCWAWDLANHIWAWPAGSIRVFTTRGTRKFETARMKEKDLHILPVCFSSPSSPEHQHPSDSPSLAAQCLSAATADSSLQVLHGLHASYHSRQKPQLSSTTLWNSEFPWGPSLHCLSFNNCNSSLWSPSPRDENCFLQCSLHNTSVFPSDPSIT